MLAQLSVQLGSAGATIILARLLTPVDFGIVALAQSLLGIATVVSLGGITAAIVTDRKEVRAKASTYFWAALLIGGCMAVAISLAARPLVVLLGQPDTAHFVQVLCLSLPLALMALVPQALLQRRLQFGRVNTVIVMGASAYFIFEIALAIAGWGAWAVIWGQVLGALVSLVSGLILARWIPSSRPRLKEIRGDLGLISNMGVGELFGYVGKNADYWAVSGLLGAGPLGIYYISYVLPSIIRVRLSGIFRQVMLPIVAKGASAEHQNELWAKATRALLALVLPIMFGLAAVAGPLVGVLFGRGWMEAADPVRMISIVGITDVMIAAVSTMAVARRQYVFRSTIIVGMRALLIGAGAVIAAMATGSLFYVAMSVLVSSIVTLLVQEFLLARPLGIGLRFVGVGTVRLFISALVMAALVYWLVEAPLEPLNQLVKLIVGVALGVVLYLGIGFIIARAAIKSAVHEVRRLVWR